MSSSLGDFDRVSKPGLMGNALYSKTGRSEVSTDTGIAIKSYFSKMPQDPIEGNLTARQIGWGLSTGLKALSLTVIAPLAIASAAFGLGTWALGSAIHSLSKAGNPTHFEEQHGKTFAALNAIAVCGKVSACVGAVLLFCSGHEKFNPQACYQTANNVINRLVDDRRLQLWTGTAYTSGLDRETKQDYKDSFIGRLLVPTGADDPDNQMHGYL